MSVDRLAKNPFYKLSQKQYEESLKFEKAKYRHTASGYLEEASIATGDELDIVTQELAVSLVTSPVRKKRKKKGY